MGIRTSSVALFGSGRRRGIVAVYVALTLVTMLGASALAVDVGYMYFRKAKAQKAADAAALAGAYALSFPNGNVADANTRAAALASANGYTNGVGNATVNTVYPAAGNSSWFRVRVARTEPLFFAGVLGYKRATIGAIATATFTAAVINAPISTNDYGADFVSGSGQTVPPYNFSIFGPQAKREWGDNLSPRLKTNGATNTEYRAPDHANGLGLTGNRQGGFNFVFNTGTMVGDKIQIELYDPCTFQDQSKSGIDEIKSDTDYNKNGPPPGKAKTTTEYSVYSDNGTPDDFSDDKLIARTKYGGVTTRDTSAAMKWVTPDGTGPGDVGSFIFDKLGPVAGKPVNYRINAVATDGSSENGFSIRGGPPRTDPTTNVTVPFNKNNGSSISAHGIIPVNFNKDGQADFALGYVPSGAAGYKLSITKFDTDVRPANGSENTVSYVCDNGLTFTGDGDSGNDAFSTDVFDLPANYQGGNWRALYNAGRADTSTWKISVSGSNTPGSIQLVE